MITCPYCGHELDAPKSTQLICPNCHREIAPTSFRDKTINVSAQQEQSKKVPTIGSPEGSGSTLDAKSEQSGQNTDQRATAETLQRPGRRSPSDDAIGKLPPLSNPGQIRELVQSIAVPESRPTMTIRQNDRQKVQIGALVLQRRSLTSQRESNADQSDYQVVGSVGEGAMGTVYAALQTSVRRDVAVKTLKAKLAKDDYDRKKFLKEACITAGLDHPNIVPVYDLGINDDGTLFYSMKLIRGKSWIEVMDEKSRVENLDILIRVCDAIAFAHSRGIVHRDIKPENVMIGAFGEVLVTDWGLALDLNQESDISFGGSPAYMAPEMASHDTGKIGLVSDVYLLGATLYQIVTGYPPHPGQTATECVLAAAENVIIPYDKSDNLLDVAYRALVADVADRYQTVADFQAAIRQYQSQLESIAFTNRGEEQLEKAKRESDYESFSKAIFSFQDAVALWPENSKAMRQEKTARLAYATLALKNENFDLGLSLVGKDDPNEFEIFKKLKQGAQHQQSRERLLKIARTSAVVLGLITLAIALGGWVYTSQQRLALANANKKLETTNTELTSAEVSLRNLNTELTNTNSDLGTANEHLGEAQTGLRNLNTELTNTNSQLGTANDKLERTNTELTIAQNSLRTANTNLTKTNTELTEAKSSLTDVLELANSRLVAAQLGRYQSDIGYADSEIKGFRIANALRQLNIVRENALLGPTYKGWELHRLYQLCNENKENLLTLGDGQTIDFLESSLDSRTQVAVLNDGSVFSRKLASGDKAAKFKRIDGLQLSAGPSKNQRKVSSLSVSQIGDSIAVSYEPIQPGAPIQDNLEIWDLDAGKRLVTITAHDRGAYLVGFTNKRLVSIGDDFSENTKRSHRYIKLWDVSANSQFAEIGKIAFLGQLKVSDAWAVSPSSDRLFYAERMGPGAYDVQMISLDGSSLPKRNTTRLQTLNKADITSIVIAPMKSGEDGTLASICGLQDGSMILVSETGKFLRQLVPNAHSGAITKMRLFGSYLMSAGTDNKVIVWQWDKVNLTQKTDLVGHLKQVVGVTLNPDGNTLTTADQGVVRQWSREGLTDEVQFAFQMGRSESNRPESGAFACRGAEFVSLIGQSNGGVRLSTPAGVSTVEINGRLTKDTPDGYPNRSLYSYDSKQKVLISSSRDGKTNFWSVNNGKHILTLDGAKSDREMLDFNESKRRIVTRGSSEGVAIVWDVDSICDVASERNFQEFNVLNYGNPPSKDSPQPIFNSLLSKNGQWMAISAGNNRYVPIVDLVNLVSKETRGHYANTDKVKQKAVCSMLFDDSIDPPIPVVAFRSKEPNGQSGNGYDIEIRRMTPNNSGNLESSDSQLNLVKAPKNFNPNEPIELVFVGYINDQTVSIVREFKEQMEEEREKKREDVTAIKASVQVWDKPVWQPGVQPKTIIDLGGVHPYSEFELWGSILTYVDPDGRPSRIDLAVGGRGQEIKGVAEAIMPDLKRGDMLKNVARQCSLLPEKQLLVAGMNYAWVLQQTDDEKWSVVFRNVPEPVCKQVGLSDDGRVGLTLHADGRVHLIQITSENGAVRADTVELNGFHDLASLSPDGATVAVYHADKGLRLLDFKRSYEKQEMVLSDSKLGLPARENKLTALTWSPDNLLVAGATDNGEIYLWDAASGDPVVDPDTSLQLDDRQSIKSISISDSGPNDQRVIAIVDSANEMRILATSGTEAESLQNWTIYPRKFSNAESANINPNYSENGFRVAVGLSNSMVEIWLVDASKGGFSTDEEVWKNQLFRVFDFSVDERDSKVISVGFDHTGRTLATLTREKMLVWLTDGWDKEKPERQPVAVQNESSNLPTSGN